MTENESAGIAVDDCCRIHTGLGPGLQESVDEAVLTRNLLLPKLISSELDVSALKLTVPEDVL